MYEQHFHAEHKAVLSDQRHNVVFFKNVSIVPANNSVTVGCSIFLLSEAATARSVGRNIQRLLYGTFLNTS